MGADPERELAEGELLGQAVDGGILLGRLPDGREELTIQSNLEVEHGGSRPNPGHAARYHDLTVIDQWRSARASFVQRTAIAAEAAHRGQCYSAKEPPHAHPPAP